MSLDNKNLYYLQSRHLKNALFFILFLSVLSYSFWFIVTSTMPADTPDVGSFRILMITLNTFAMIGVFIWSIKNFPRYTYCFSQGGIEVTTNKKFTLNEITPDKSVQKRMGVIGTQTLSYSLDLIQKMGNLAFIFAKIKQNSFSIPYDKIEKFFIQQSWVNYLTHTTSIFLVGKKGSIMLEHMDKSEVEHLLPFLQQIGITANTIQKIFFMKPVC